MRAISRLAVLLAAALMVLPLWAADEKKPDAKKDIDKTAANTEKTVKAGVIAGKILAIVESKKSLRVQITLQVPKFNQGAANAIAQAQIQYAQAAARRDLNGMASAQRTMAQNEANLITLQSVTKDLEIGTTDDFQVRLANPPPQFDEKGKIKKYTAKELKELRGDSKLPGYKGEFSDLAIDQIVSLTLVRKKSDTPKPIKPKGKDADVDLMADLLPQASVIVVVHDPSASNPPK